MEIIILRFGVYRWESFRFPDKTERTKFWIPLVCELIKPNITSERDIPSLLPTSRIDKYTNQRVVLDTIRLLKGESKLFQKETLLDLKYIQQVKEKDIAQAIIDGKLEYKGLLEDFLSVRIVSAIREARTLSVRTKKELLCEAY